jgi:2-dehydro-3-deoxy-D-arabinonate dehydratase
VYIVRFAQPHSTGPRVGVTEEGLGSAVHPVDVGSLAELLARSSAQIRSATEQALTTPPVDGEIRLLPPVDGRTEVWASGVTYERSRDARVEESTQKSVYEQVYDADRPELFLKSVAWRVVTDGEPIGIRSDSDLNVPEPEVAIVLNSGGEIVGYLVCDDVSSRVIEGENPLYLPQAKVYAGACALSAGIRPAWEVDDPTTLPITLSVTRAGAEAFRGETSTDRMHRSFDDLARWLYAGDAYPAGTILSTGTGIIPGLEFTLAEGDQVSIEVGGIGTLSNQVAVGAQPFAFLLSPGADGYDRGA